MSKAKLLGMYKPYVPNSRADQRRIRAWKRNREYTDRHEEVLQEKRDGKRVKQNAE